MPSSISSSDSIYANHRTPEQPWGRIMVLALLLTASLLAAAEGYWRGRDVRPSVTDSPALWAHHRQRIKDSGEKSIVIVGTSRGQMGIDVDRLESRFPDYSIVQLAIASGGVPPATIADLAADPQFRGILLVEAMPNWIHASTWDAQREFVDAYHNPPFATTELETLLAAHLQSRFAILRASNGLRSLLSGLLLGRDPDESPRWMSVNRCRKADFSKVDIAKLQTTLMKQEIAELQAMGDEVERSLIYDDWLRQIEKLASLSEQMLDRGCQVVFVRFPTSGDRVPLDEIKAPRHRYWDVFTERMPAEAVTIHFADEPTLRNFTCPDMSHLDYRDATRFTDALADLLVEKNVIGPQ